jgi:cellulose synthase/poly-beta-1,6-N-acetylglucosamine synthase-like glycosyltransferase
MEKAAIWLGYAIAASLCIVGYAYAGYPALVYVCSRLFGRKPQRPLVPAEQLPSVTLLIAAYNEARDIRERILNALQLEYPRGKLEIIIASDGSSDETAKIAREYASKGVRVIEFPVRRGKSSVLNDVIPHCRGEVIMFSDANTSTEPDSVRNLAAWFSDPEVGVVCGKLILVDPIKGRNVDSLYWKYETFLKTCEARLGALLGSNGGIYALRKVVYQEIPGDTIVDDFVIPLLARERTGCKIVYDVEAVAYEETPSSIASEFQRRARIGAGGFQAITLLSGLLNPKHGWLSFAFFNHKVLRWFSPLFLGFALFGNLLWIAMCMPHVGNVFHLPWAALFLMCQVAFYASSLLSGMLPTKPKLFKIFRLSAMFTSMNAALAVGFWRWYRGKQNCAWKRTLREGEVAGMVNPLFDTKEHLLMGQETARTPQDTGIDIDPIPQLPSPASRSARVAS